MVASHRGPATRTLRRVMALFVCATPIGNLADVTVRVLDCLRSADAVVCEDTRRSRKLLERYEIRAELVSLDQHHERERIPSLLARLEAGETLALISDAGLPALSDPGSRLIAEARVGGHDVTVLPGPSAPATALVASGLVAERFTFVGFLPRRDSERQALWLELSGWEWPAVAFESPRRLAASLASLAAFDPTRRVSVCRELTKLHEEVVTGEASELAERFANGTKGEVTLVFGAPARAGAAELAGALEAVGALVDSGAPRKVAARVVSELTGLAANELYQGSIEQPEG